MHSLKEMCLKLMVSSWWTYARYTVVCIWPGRWVSGLRSIQSPTHLEWLKARRRRFLYGRHLCSDTSNHPSWSVTPGWIQSEVLTSDLCCWPDKNSSETFFLAFVIVYDVISRSMVGYSWCCVLVTRIAIDRIAIPRSYLPRVIAILLTLLVYHL